MEKSYKLFNRLYPLLLSLMVVFQPLCGMSTMLQVSLIDWSKQMKPVDRFLPIFPAVVADVCSFNGTPQPFFTTSLSAVIGASLKARAFAASCQDAEFGLLEDVSESIAADIRHALVVFCRFTPKQAEKIVIKEMNPAARVAFGTLRDTSLGIFATNNRIFVDSEFLSKYKNDPLLYGLFLGHGLCRLQHHSFAKRQLLSIADGVAAAFAISYLVGYAARLQPQKLIDYLAQSAGVSAQTTQESWLYWGTSILAHVGAAKLLSRYVGSEEAVALLFERLAGFGFGWGIVLSKYYNKLSEPLKSRLYESTERFEPGIVQARMDNWLSYCYRNLDGEDREMSSSFLECDQCHQYQCYEYRLSYLEKKLAELLCVQSETPWRRWVIGKLYTSMQQLKKSVPMQKKCA